MKEHNKNFYSLEEVERCLEVSKDFQDGEEIYYFIGALRYVYDENKRLNNIINELKNENEKLYNLCETNNICYLQGLEDSEKINGFKYSDFVKKWLKDTKEKLQRGDIYEQSNNNRKE